VRGASLRPTEHSTERNTNVVLYERLVLLALAENALARQQVSTTTKATKAS
jgi:hypothetical protein